MQLHSLHALIDMIPVACVVYDSDGNHLVSNEIAQKRYAFFRTTDHSVEELHDCVVSIDDKPVEKEKLPFFQVLGEASLIKDVHLGVRFSERVRHFSVSASAATVEGSDVVVLALHEFKAKERAVLGQKRFVKLIGHELKQPLAMIQAYAYSLRKLATHKEDDKLELLKKINQKVRFISGILDQIVLFSESGFSQIDRQSEKSGVCNVIKEVLADFRVLHPSHAFEMQCADTTTTAAVPKVVLMQILQNILKNAVKYSAAQTTVNVGFTLKDDTVLLHVKDEGIGIAADELDTIFDPYYRVAATSKQVSGLGLGLSYVKNVAEAAGGEVWAESEVGVGTTVFASLPR